MTHNTVTAIFLSFAIVAGPAYADPEVAEQKVTPLFEGETAKFDGFLVPELRLDEYTLAETDAKELRLRLGSEKERCRKIQEVYVVKLKEATVPPRWYETPNFHRITGFIAGLVVAGAAVKAASTLSR